ncbi:MAG: hypothetical protein FD123_2033 [Bacteroidetes bacterium]|nr:MAG: hypothetical protein FD123_2033 [Bacteroidota bacterium]
MEAYRRFLYLVVFAGYLAGLDFPLDLFAIFEHLKLYYEQG